jgi:glycerophosphoryl diester phosphodiesterase
MKPLVIAHRGASAYAPENTLAAFHLAFEMGADGIELDVELTKDGVPVVFHFDPNQQTHGRRTLQDLTLAQVKQLDAGAWFDAKYRGEKIPTLEQVLAAVGARGLIVIEIKWSAVALGNDDLERATARVIAQAVNAHHIVISSFHPIALYRMRQLAPHLPRALIYQTEIMPALLNGPWFRALVQPRALHFDCQMLDEKRAAWARRAQYEIVAWHTEEPAEIKRLITLGVDGIMSNAPDVLRRAVDEIMSLDKSEKCRH